MSDLRVGDTVLFRARVTGVAAYDGKQQITAKLLPNGQDLGWCVPNEYDFRPDTYTLKVGDRARYGTMLEDYEIVHLSEDGQAVVKKVGNWPLKVVSTKDLVRI